MKSDGARSSRVARRAPTCQAGMPHTCQAASRSSQEAGPHAFGEGYSFALAVWSIGSSSKRREGMKLMKLMFPLAMAVLATPALTRSAAWAGSPHFVSCSVVPSNAPNELSVNGKEAGLGNEEQVDIVLTATALCINNGGKHPKAVNKTGVTAAETVPVQNGKTDFTVTG